MPTPDMSNPALDHAARLRDLLQKAVAQGASMNVSQATANLADAKRALAQLGALLPSPAHPPAVHVLARDLLECGCLVSIRAHDTAAFERYYAQVAPFYAVDDAAGTQGSPRALLIRGLHLLHLLAQHRIAEFHAALELVPASARAGSNPYIAHAVQLEQALMDGSLHHVWHAREDVPADECRLFLDALVLTLRKEMANAIEVAYAPSLPVAALARRLFLDPAKDADQLRALCNEQGWQMDAVQGVVHFGQADAVEGKMDAQGVIQHALMYARELERIV
ncbi:hypothetical protein AMAG_15843 [Allomyces macrogynus ATCC 38327]|uniref:CSN8/PSMD8/EIF3K domain-containing protein n=1 Tax=Allomyces macrogynus (strain ATCC 38327) TaxID=578462 RepID=A0A0L0T8U8_ALLM3|nr:hypothetical protein AMAG_15843 [Allomyces macrogynus ATCC 38327]|eukprot:KNE71182.1 hypothetical protein AMAG_15843 [Allomyces macrogynus ATCC 38327]